MIIYSNSLKGEFCCDDLPYIVDSESIRNITDIPRIWQTYNTRFLVGLSFAFNYWLGGMEVWGYHVFNIFLHILAALLVQRFIYLTLKTPVMQTTSSGNHKPELAFFAALIFLCHPIQTEGVTYILQRAVSLATIFYLGTLIFYIQARLSGHRLFYIMSWLMMITGFFIKEMTVTVIASLIAYEIYFFGKDKTTQWKQLSRLLPFCGGILLLFLIMRQIKTDAVTQVQYVVSPEFFDWRYVFTEINVLRTYLRLLLIPIHQNYLYDYPVANGLFQASTLFSLAVLTSLLMIAFVWYRSPNSRILSFSIVWFFITTSVEATAVIFGARNVIYDHWLYLPMVGYAIFLTFFLHKFFVQQAAFKRVMTGIILLFCTLTYQRNFVWQTEISLWEDVIQKSPRMAGSHFGLAEAYHHKKIYHKAYDHYQKALVLYQDPSRIAQRHDWIYISRIANNLALIAFIFGQDREMIQYFQKAISANPSNAAVYRNAGVIYYELHCYEEALTMLKQGIALDSDHPKSYHYQGLIYAAINDHAQAESYLKKALMLYERTGNQKEMQEVRQAIATLADTYPPLLEACPLPPLEISSQ
jgi:tetratricopeptide (TPR) repeat protein